MKVKLSSVAQIVSGATPSTKHQEYYDGNIIWATPKDLSDQGGKYFFKGERNITKEGFDSCSASMIPPNNILMSSRAPIGLIAINRVPCCTNQGFKSLILNHEKCDTDYIYYYLKSHIREIEALAGGTTFKEISRSAFEKYEIELPDLETQRNIGRVLSALDSKIITNNTISSKLESMAKTIYDYWFLQYDFPDEHGRPYRSSGGKMVWNEELKREVPDGWKTTTVGEITVNHDSERIPVKNSDRDAMKGTIPYYGATGIMGYVNRPIFNGDYVLLAEDGSVMDDKGHPIIQRITGKTWINNHTHVLEPKNGYHCRLLMLMLKQIPVVMIKTGSIQMKINQENMNNYHVLDIPQKYKEQANVILDDIDAQLIHIDKENQALSSLRDFLLPMLMNGQVTFKEDA